ncbi:ABC transporter substrate-binding protein [Nesterenkonia halophila]|uniref:ABC transporter substrate-binding protein n=1 Tax=Nesterenkonia halophila TaxID=302044 RepID=UPI001FEB75FA|nr:extracellular solute-binding protein [Nesterenkonia halophila]
MATGEVSFAHWRGEDRKIFKELIADFTKVESEISVAQDISPSDDYEAQALRRMRNGSVGDVAPAFRGAQFESFVESGFFVDLEPTDLTSRYKAELITAGSADGVQYGYPYQIVFNDPIANLDILEKAGYPEPAGDWDSYLDMLDKIQSQGVTPIAMPGADAGNAGQLINPMIMNLGPTEDMCAKIESGEYKLTDDWFLEMLRKYGELGDYVQPNASGTAAEPAQQMFATGEAAILATGSYHMASVRSLGAEFPIDIAPPITSDPGQAVYLAAYNATFILGINSASEVQGAGIAWLEYLSRPEVAGAYADGTAQFSPVKGVEYENPDLDRVSSWLEKDILLAPRYQFTDLDMRAAVEDSCLQALTGTEPEKAAEDAQHIVDQRIDS